MLVLDGVYTDEPDGPRFHHVAAPDAQTLARLVDRIIRRLVRHPTGTSLLSH